MRFPGRRRIERQAEPTLLSLEQAVEWIKQERPIVWLGSIFSVPEPSGLPSGFGITNSLFSLLLQGAIPQEQHDDLIRTLSPRWPLEALLDEFELVGLDLSESFLDFFNEQNDRASPSALHEAVVSYYQKGLARVPLCITTNWDTLQEKAFQQNGFEPIAGGPGEMPGQDFGKDTGDSKTIFIYHPHGCFSLRDVVCSFRREQRQLALHPDLLRHPTLFLGYSGYEPSLYFHLEHDAGQLWCVRNKDDFNIPAKRRLLSRPNTSVYVGDVRDLLSALGILDHNVELQGKQLANTGEGFPRKVLEVVRSRVLCSLDSTLCSNMLIHELLSVHDEPEGSIRYCTIMRALVEHLRDRSSDPAIIGGLLSSAHFRNSEQLWISVVAFLLRHDSDVPKEVIDLIISRSQEAPSSGLEKEESAEDLFVYGFGSCKQRANIYKKYLALSATILEPGESTEDKGPLSDEGLSVMTALYSSDLGALGEFIEILAFEQIRNGQPEQASAYFDYAASCFYLRGLWNAGRLNEWAAANVEEINRLAKNKTLLIPAQSRV
jgi:hypothetical protein